MTGDRPSPGIARADRISRTGLQRLEAQLQSGVRISDRVLAQWLRRYGEPARILLRRYGRYTAALDEY